MWFVGVGVGWWSEAIYSAMQGEFFIFDGFLLGLRHVIFLWVGGGCMC